jgi:hypothetical protein
LFSPHDHIGYHAGALAGTFCAAQFFSAVLWGKFSDEYGRKPGIILGVIGAAIGMLVLGFSKTFLQAILGRALCGFLSGNIGVIKSFLTEITDDTNRGKGFSFMQLGWSLGTICGPLAGGLLCYPASKYPKFFSESGVFGEFPFLLPCLLCAIVNIFTALYCFFFMSESRKLPQDQSTSPTSVSNYSKVLDDQDEEEAVALWSDEMDSSLHGNADPEEPREARRSLLKGILPNFSFGSASEGYSQLTTKESSFSESHEDLEFGTNCTDTSSQKSNDSISFLPLASDETSSECEPRASLSDALTDDTSMAEDDRILNPQAINAILCYGLCCMAFIVMDESLPLMLKLDSQEGGLSFTSSQIGTLLSTGGIAMLVWSVTLLPTVASRSKLLIFRVSTLIGIPIALSYPILASFRNEIFELFGEHLGHNIIFGCLFLSITARNCLSTSIFMTVSSSYSPLSLSRSHLSLTGDHLCQSQRLRLSTRDNQRNRTNCGSGCKICWSCVGWIVLVLVGETALLVHQLPPLHFPLPGDVLDLILLAEQHRPSQGQEEYPLLHSSERRRFNPERWWKHERG